MKKKLHVSVWALGILVLLLSQLTMLMPASRAYAAPLTLSDYQNSARKFSAYAAFHECLLKIPSGYTTAGTTLGAGKLFSGLGGLDVVVIGYVDDLGSGDGKVYCDEAAQKWYEQAGYTSVTEMMNELGFAYRPTLGSCGGVTNQGGCTIETWALDVAPSVLSSNHQSSAKSRGIPLSINDTGVKYSLAVAAMQGATCSTSLTPATAANPPDTVALISDNSGAISYSTFSMGTTTTGTASNTAGTSNTMVAAFPDPVKSNAGSSIVKCSDLITFLNSSAGTASLSATMVAARIDQTSADIATAACAEAGITDQAQLATCIKDFTGWAKQCIEDYYKNNSVSTGGVSYSATFDPNVVAACIYGKSSTKYKNVTRDSLAGIVQSAMDANTPAAMTSTSPTDDPCAMLPANTQIRWLACSLLLAGKGVADVFYSVIQHLLYTPVDVLFSADGFKKMATTFRVVGLGLIIIMALIMVIAQASGSDMVDAYTVKKVLPRVAIAIIGIALSMPLLKLGIGVTNDLGIALGTFVSDLAGGTTTSAATDAGDVANLIVTGTLGTAAAGVTLAVTLGAWGILSLLGTILLALLIGLVVLAFRQLLIVMLVIMAPLAIAASVMPGTDKLWKFWRTTLVSTLMMFPIIMLFLSSGRLMASLFGKMEGDPNINALMAVLVYFAPYFLLPFAFKMAGGLMASIFQIANDKGKGAFDRLRNARGEIRKKRLKNAGDGHLWDPDSKVQKALRGNKIASWIGDPKGTGAYTLRNVPGFRRAGGIVESKVAAAKREHTEKLANVLTAAGLNDRAGRALSGLYEGLTESTREKIIAAGLGDRRARTVRDVETLAHILSQSQGQGSDAIGERSAGQQLLAVRGAIAGAYLDPEMGKADIGAAGFLLTASQGYASAQDINTFGNRLNKDMGLVDATAITGRAIDLASSKRIDVGKGYSNIQDADGNWHSGDTGTEEERNRLGDLLLKLGYNDFASAKAESFDGMQESILYNLTSRDEGTREAQLGQLQQILSGAYGTPAMRAKAYDFVHSGFRRVVGVDADKNPIHETVTLPDDILKRLVAAPRDLTDDERNARAAAGGGFNPQHIQQPTNLGPPGLP